MSHSIRFCVLASSIWLLIIVIVISTARTAVADSQALRARDILKQRCFQCHGANGVARKNIFVLDRERLLSSKTVIPGDTSSPLLKVIESGAMPMGGPELPDEEKAALGKWIADGAADWEKAEEAADKQNFDKRTFLTESGSLALIRDDLLRAQVRSRPFLRYFSLAHLYNAGVPDDEMETYRVALAKLVNSLSWHREITQPTAIDAARTIFRVDLRDYNWTAATWDTIIAAYPYAIRTEQSQTIAQLSGAALPYIRADWFAATASVPPLYHDMLALPKTAQELEQQLGINTRRDLEEEKNVARAGLRTSGVSQNNRVLERHASPHGAYWKSFDFRSSLGDQNIFTDPIRLNPAGGEIIFNLPNGLQAYLLVDALSRRINEAPIAIVADRNNADDPVIRNGRSCMSCHYEGAQGFKDDVRPVVRGSISASFDREKALAIYPAQETLDQLIGRDRERFQKAAAATGGLARSPQAEPVNALARRFLAEMPVAQAAAEAGLGAREFQFRVAGSARLMELGYGQLLVAGGGIKRDAWDRNFGDLVRELELGEYAGTVIVLQRSFSERLLDRAFASARPGAGNRPVSVTADPASIMRSARTISVRSMTVYLEAEELESELRKRPEFKSLELVIVKDEQLADIRIDINRAEFSFNYVFSALNPQTKIVVASGKVTAWNGGFAAPEIAKDFLKQLQAARK